MNETQIIIALTLVCVFLFFRGRKHTEHGDVAHLRAERDVLFKKLSRYEEMEERRGQQLEEQLTKLSQAERSFEEEKLRVRRKEEEQRALEEEQRDKQWSHFEQQVMRRMEEIFYRLDLQMPLYTNTDLPSGFGGTLKPDFMIEVAGGYVVMDVKHSRTEQFDRYIKDQVKKTAQKLSKKKGIHHMVYFIVPTDGIAQMKETLFFEQGYHFSVISVEALPGVLDSLQRLGNYDVLGGLDPTDQEHVCGFIAETLQHVNFESAVHSILSMRGKQVLEKAHELPDSLRDSVVKKLQKSRIPQISPTAVKEQML